MVKNKKLLWGTSAVASTALLVSVLANAVGANIKVTTTVDENGENAAACSLREAITAVNTREAFGGCAAGALVGENVIELDNATYNLSVPTGEVGELTLKATMTIAGKTTWQFDQINPITGQKPDRVRPLTVIKAAANSRIFDAAGSAASLSLRDLKLQGNGQVAGKGGMIYATGGLSLENVQVENMDAQGDGGVVFLGVDGAYLSAKNVTFANNRSDAKGGVLAMSCAQDLSALAKHEITLSESLMRDNKSVAGAGVIEACGNATISMTNATLSKNESATGAIAYAQNIVAGFGSIELNQLTAVEHTVGSVLYLDKLAKTTVASSVLAWNTAGSCSIGIKPTSVSSLYNAFDDLSCAPLTVPGATTHNQTITTALANELAPLGDHKGLVDVYLPLASSLFILNKASTGESCSGSDQRGSARGGGDCDIGAAERMQVAAADVIAENNGKTGRRAIVDVLAKAQFGESDTAIYQLDSVLLPGPSDTTDPDFMYDAALYGGATPKCKWHDDSETDELLRRRLVVDTAGVLTGATPIKCQYKVTDTGPNTSKPAEVTAEIKNMAPIAKADQYIRPVGTRTLQFDPVANDTDEGDGTYGAGSWWQSTPARAYIYVAESSQPKLGKLIATEGPCADSTLSNPKVCYYPPLTYEAYNSDSPFSDSFTYVVYDKEGSPSSSATVTIKTDEPDPEKGEGGGSVGLWQGLVLLLLGGWRRLRQQ